MLALLFRPLVSTLSCPLMSTLFCLPVPTLSRLSIPALLSTPIAGLLSPSVPALLSLLSPVSDLLSLFMPVLLSFPPLVASFLSLSIPALSSLCMPTFLSCSVPGPAPTYLISSALRILKWALSNEPLVRRHSISPSSTKLLCLFPILDPLSKKTDQKQPFDITFINSCLFAGNHAVKEVNLTFGKCIYSAPVKLKRLWQWKLLDCKLLYIMDAFFLAATLFQFLLSALF